MAQSRAVLCTSSQPLKVEPLSLRFSSACHVQVVLNHVIMRGKQKPAGPARRIAEGLSRLRLDHVHHGLDQRAGSEVLASAGLGILCVLLQETFVCVAFHISAHHRPVFLIDQVDDKPPQL